MVGRSQRDTKNTRKDKNSLIQKRMEALLSKAKAVASNMEGREIKWREDEEEDVGSYWMTLMKRGDIGTWDRQH